MTASGWSSWGGHAVPDEQGSGWVGLFSLMANKCGLRDYHRNSESIMAVADEVDGPYSVLDTSDPDAAANVAVGAPSHCTQIKRHPSGEYHLWHIFAGELDNSSSSDPQPPKKDCRGKAAVQPAPLAQPRGVEGGFQQQIFIHTAQSPRGPWSKHGTPITIKTVPHTTAVGSSCTAPYYFKNGTALIVWGGGACPQGWGGSGGAHGSGVGCLWAGAAGQWQGPYQQLGTGDPVSHPENEDPAIFTDARGNFHMLTNVNTGHRRCGSGVACGGHAWSEDGVTWSDTFVGAFGPNALMEDGGIRHLGYVERPQIAQRVPGAPPLALFLSAGPKYMEAPTLTWAQRFCDDREMQAGRCGFMGGLPLDGGALPATVLV